MTLLRIETARAFAPLLHPARYKGARGGRGSGKSHFFAGLLVEDAIRTPGLRAVCIREVQKDLKHSAKQLIEDKIREFGAEGRFTIREADIVTPGGGVLIFQGMQNHTADSIKSLEGFDRAWVEEAQTLSQRSLDLLRPTIRAEGSELWFSWNPRRENDPVEAFFANPPEGTVLVTANWDANPWLPAELRAEKDHDYRRDPDKAAHIWGGEYESASEARIFRNFRVGYLDPPDNVVWFYGVDWGFSVDPLAGVRLCFPDPRTLYVADEVYEVGVPTERVPAALDALPDARRWPITADNARPETIDYVRRHGFPRLRPAVKGRGSIEDGITFLQGFDIVISPRCPNVLSEFQRYAYKRDRQTEEILPVVEDAWNHAIDAIRYACEGLHRKGKVIPGAIRAERTAPRDYGPNEWGNEAEGWRVV